MAQSGIRYSGQERFKSVIVVSIFEFLDKFLNKLFDCFIDSFISIVDWSLYFFYSYSSSFLLILLALIKTGTFCAT